MIESLGPYRLLNKVGSGGLGESFRARDTVRGRTVLVKVLPADLVNDPDRREQFLHDVRAACTLSHPNIATLFEIGDDGSYVYLVFEYVPGQTLRTLTAGQPLNVRTCVDIAVQLADALAEAHAVGIIHGDIKADNIILNPKGHAKILDFGLSAWTEGGVARRRASGHTAAALPLTTIAYLSPEEALGRTLDRRTDLFSMGSVLSEMMTGHTPFAADSAQEMLRRIVHDAAPPPSRLNQDVPREIDAIVLRLLSKPITERPESAASVAAELRSVAAVLDVRAGEREPPTVVQPKTRTQRWLVPVTILVVLAVLIAAASITWSEEADRAWRQWFGS